ncbi:MAG: preprotein translocase subunit SecE [Myxococcaceae bacterium]
MADEASQQANRSGMDPQRLVVIFYLAFGIILALFFGKIFDTISDALGSTWGRTEIGEGLGWHVNNLLGVAVAGGCVAFAFLHPRVRQLSLEVASELMKVTWPSWAETRVSTVAVIVASLVSAVILFGIDTLAYKLMVEWLPHVWGMVNG